MTNRLLAPKRRPSKIVNDEFASTSSMERLPELVIEPSDLPKAAKRLAFYLARSALLFEQSGRVVQVIETQGESRVANVTPDGLIVHAHELCRPVELVTFRGQLSVVPRTLRTKIVRLYLSMPELWGLRRLNGIAAAPLLSDDGTIRTAHGYDSATGLWCVGFDLPAISDRPSLGEAKTAFRLLRTVFSTFPFADSPRSGNGDMSVVDLSKQPGADESAFLIQLLTAVCRPSLPHAPALLITAPMLSGAGTGKGLLVRAIGEIAFGHAPQIFTVGRGERAELTKRLEAILLQSPAMVSIDNVNASVLNSNFLAQVITESNVSVRLLSQSVMAQVPSNTFLAITGNAVGVTEDLARRVVLVELDAKCEHPERRVFDYDFHAVVAKKRAELQAALLCIWRWAIQNRVDRGAALGSFERWGSWCRDPLLALGCRDPVSRIQAMKDVDSLRRTIFEMLEAWFAVHGSQPRRFAEIAADVRAMLGKSQQAQVSRLTELGNVRLQGFVLRIEKSRGRWGDDRYVVERYDGDPD